MVLLKTDMIPRSDKHDNFYRCDWCGFEFSQVIKKSTSGTPEAPKKVVSDHAVCPQCNKTIKTWE